MFKLQLLFPGWTERHFQRVASLIEENSMVLELGCGSGRLQKFLQQTKDCICVGLDIAPGGFQQNRHLFVHADGVQLPFRDSVFDIVMSHQFMSHVRLPLHSLIEQIRVLKLGGRLIMSDGNLLSPAQVFDLLFLYPIRTRGQRGGFKWMKRVGKGIVYKNYHRGTPQMDEEIRSRFY